MDYSALRLIQKSVVRVVTDFIFTFMKRRGTIVDFPYHSGLSDDEVRSTNGLLNVSLI